MKSKKLLASALSLLCLAGNLPQLCEGTEGTATGSRMEKILKGEDLSELSYRLYGSHRHWMQIAELNQDQISNPNFVVAGMEVKVPNLPYVKPTGPHTHGTRIIADCSPDDAAKSEASVHAVPRVMETKHVVAQAETPVVESKKSDTVAMVQAAEDSEKTQSVIRRKKAERKKAEREPASEEQAADTTPAAVPQTADIAEVEETPAAESSAPKAAAVAVEPESKPVEKPVKHHEFKMVERDASPKKSETEKQPEVDFGKSVAEEKISGDSLALETAPQKPSKKSKSAEPADYGRPEASLESLGDAPPTAEDVQSQVYLTPVTPEVKEHAAEVVSRRVPAYRESYGSAPTKNAEMNDSMSLDGELPAIAAKNEGSAAMELTMDFGEETAPQKTGGGRSPASISNGGPSDSSNLGSRDHTVQLTDSATDDLLVLHSDVDQAKQETKKPFELLLEEQ